MDAEDRKFIVGMFEQFRIDIRTDIITEVRAQLNQFRAELNQFRVELNQLKADLNQFKSEFRAELNQFQVEVRKRFDGLGNYLLSHDRSFLEQAEGTASLEQRIDRLEKRVDRLEDAG